MKDRWQKIGRYFLVFVLGIIISCVFFYWVMNKCLKARDMSSIQYAWTNLTVIRAFREGKTEHAIKVLDDQLNSDTIFLCHMKESELNDPTMQSFIAHLVDYRKIYKRQPMQEPQETLFGKEVDKFLDKYKNLQLGGLESESRSRN